MNAHLNSFRYSRRSGQTLAMALILMGVLLVLGVVFIALINRNIKSSATTQRRSESYDLAEAGIRYVHSQMLFSLQGADWRPTPTSPASLSQQDPDYDYLRLPATGDPNDYGGPDRLGPYVRLNLERGRALIRVRYAPSDPTVFATGAVGDFLQAGKARNYTIVEAVGKAGRVIPNDPTTMRQPSGTVVEKVESTKLVGFITTGLTEQARFIENKFNTTHPIELGAPNELGAVYSDTGAAAPVLIPVIAGTAAFMPNPDLNGSSTNAIPYGGGMVINGDVVFHGTFIANLNSLLGDRILASGTMRGADDQSTLVVQAASPAGANWNVSTFNLTNAGVNSLDSSSPRYNTVGGLVRDGSSAQDAVGYPRQAPRIEPSSVVATDPETGQNRYIQGTQSSGKLLVNGNTGRFGFGQGLFVNNNSSRQMRADEQGREDVGTAESLVYDWLNPNNGQRGSGWKGSFYVPKGAYLRLLSDGFAIIRDDQNWREPDGSIGKRPGAAMNSANPADVLDSPYARFKIVWDPNTRQNYIFSSYSVLGNNVIDIDQVNTGTIGTYRAAGFPFNGLLYFQGNVRVRGEIPTDVQLTVVSNATIYIEGSITKGIINHGTRSNLTLNSRIDTPSRSMLALLAKDYVAVNTTQFLGSDPLQQLEEVRDLPSAVEWNAVRVRTGGAITLGTEILLDPNSGTPTNPSTWLPFVTQYVTPGTTNPMATQMLLSHTSDDGPAPMTVLNMDVNYPVGNSIVVGGQNYGGTWQYLFELSSNNSTTPYFAPNYTPPGPYTSQNIAPLYGLGGQAWQRFSKFESGTYPLVNNTFNFNNVNLTLTGSNANRSGAYTMLLEQGNSFTLAQRNSVGGAPTNDYLLARAAVIPHDVRIEATIMAEEGSFFIIPGPWVNPNPNDRRDAYVDDLTRLENFGSMPGMPFYGEPIDVRVQVIGSVTENLPPPISQQAEWLKKWGWIPRFHGASGELIPAQHVPNGFDVTATSQYVPNLSIIYDPALATGRNGGFVAAAGPNVDASTMIRSQGIDLDGDGAPDMFQALPPLPRLPVSPTLAYFGEVKK